MRLSSALALACLLAVAAALPVSLNEKNFDEEVGSSDQPWVHGPDFSLDSWEECLRQILCTVVWTL